MEELKNLPSSSFDLVIASDSLVYVVRADSTPSTLVLKNVNMIRHSNLPLTGVVLNKYSARKQGAYGYGKDGHESGYYGYGQS